jgi:hypothetical protein
MRMQNGIIPVGHTDAMNVSVVTRVQEVITKIKDETQTLPILSEKQKEDSREVLRLFDLRMKRMMCATYDNLENYQMWRWKALFWLDGEEDESKSTI